METLVVMLRNVRFPLIIIIAHASFVCLLQFLELYKGVLLTEAFTSIGTAVTAVAMIVAFRFRVSYERWREADMLWREIKTDSLSLFTLVYFHLKSRRDISNASLLLNEIRENLIDFVTVIHNSTITHQRLFLKNSEQPPSPRMPDQNLPYQVVYLKITSFLEKCFNEKFLPLEQARYFNLHLNKILNCTENLIRIRLTRPPQYYRNFNLVLVYFLSFIAPYFLVGTLKSLMVPLVSFNAAVFLMLDQMSNRGEMPFGDRKSDVPSKKIVADLDAQLRLQIEFQHYKNTNQAA